MESNPYQTPSANLFGSSAATGEAVPSEAIVQLQRTKGWVRLIGVLMWIAVVIMLLVGVAIISTQSIGLFAAGGEINAYQSGQIFGLAAVYAIFAFLYIYPAIKIWKYGSAIKKLSASRQPEDLVAALNHQRGFWKFCGIMALIVLVIYAVMFVVIGVAGVAGAMGGMKALESLPAPEQ